MWPCNIHCSVYNICDKTLSSLTVNSTSHLRSNKCLKPNKTQCTVAKPLWLLTVAIRISEKPRDASFFTLKHGNTLSSTDGYFCTLRRLKKY